MDRALAVEAIIMTYREYIQKEIEEIEKRYDTAGGLRDVAEGKEKDTWNEVRRLTREVSTILRRLDNGLPKGRAGMEV
jgi:hypothetical protein